MKLTEQERQELIAAARRATVDANEYADVLAREQKNLRDMARRFVAKYGRRSPDLPPGHSAQVIPFPIKNVRRLHLV